MAQIKKRIIFVIIMVAIFIVLNIIIFFLNTYILLNLLWSDILSISSSIFLGFAALYFTYNEFLNKEEENKPKYSYDFSIDNLLTFMKDMQTENLFFVFKNVGSTPIYNLNIWLEGTYQSQNKELIKMNLISLLPGEKCFFNVGHSILSLDSTPKARIIVNFENLKCEPQDEFIYDLINNKNKIQEYFNNIRKANNKNIPDARRTYDKLQECRGDW